MQEKLEPVDIAMWSDEYIRIAYDYLNQYCQKYSAKKSDLFRIDFKNSRYRLSFDLVFLTLSFVYAKPAGRGNVKEIFQWTYYPEGERIKRREGLSECGVKLSPNSFLTPPTLKTKILVKRDGKWEFLGKGDSLKDAEAEAGLSESSLRDMYIDGEIDAYEVTHFYE